MSEKSREILVSCYPHLPHFAGFTLFEQLYFEFGGWKEGRVGLVKTWIGRRRTGNVKDRTWDNFGILFFNFGRRNLLAPFSYISAGGGGFFLRLLFFTLIHHHFHQNFICHMPALYCPTTPQIFGFERSLSFPQETPLCLHAFIYLWYITYFFIQKIKSCCCRLLTCPVLLPLYTEKEQTNTE